MKKQLKKRKLVMYSGGREGGNIRLHRALGEFAGKKPRSLTYIPYSHENGAQYFKRVKARYQRFGIKKFKYFPVDSDFLMKEMKEALKSDIIYLAGGNTYYFLKHLRESGFLGKIPSFLRRGGILAGLSAGALVMTPHIELAGYPPHEGDLNEVRLKNLKALGLVNFEFLPHFTNSSRTITAMLKYSRKSKNPIIACPDGSGVVVNEDEVRIFGPAYLFYMGRKARIA